MSRFPTKAHEKRKAGSESLAPHLKPSTISKETKVDSLEEIFINVFCPGLLKEGASSMNSEKATIDLTAEHAASPFSSSLVSELDFEEFDQVNYVDVDGYLEYDYEFDDRSKYESSDDDDDDDYSPKRMEAETKVHFLKSKTARCMLSIYVTKEEDNNWLDNIRVECFYKGDLIGHAFGRYIHRQGIKYNFLNIIKLSSHEMGEIAGEIFNKFGCLLHKFKEHVIQRGTGAWGAEMDVGPLLLLEQIRITDRWFRRKGLGRAMVKALIQKSQVQADPFRRLHVIAKPGWFLDDIAEETHGKSKREKRAMNCRALDSAIAFYCYLGFRRIGSSSCFGFSVDPKHKAHSINVDADYDLPRADEELEISDDENIVATSSFSPGNEVMQKRLVKLKQRLSLEHAINTLSDAELVAFFKTFDSKNGSGWKEINSHHNNVLHQAGCALKVYATKWLIKILIRSKN
ncbi:hypothetical protein BPAE_0002g00060 [Botrytis paeoniae]|uniref:Uncharacterized protein n=1 Tax=Botrytis paeoniae TaxID=278948 RepID=A0A4Z1G1N0_9HELO|nr:hypothetical protein BPAE_0002g00060 [Botrytis paeoniae]